MIEPSLQCEKDVVIMDLLGTLQTAVKAEPMKADLENVIPVEPADSESQNNPKEIQCS